MTASRSGNTVYLHVVNTNRTKAVKSTFRLDNGTIRSGRIFELATDPEFEIMSASNDLLVPREKVLQADVPYAFSPASVSAVELTLV